jgi:murein DD-endopeptidase MepM/ murein hydrolase activator NlpD
LVGGLFLLLAPSPVGAGFFSSIFSNDAYAGQTSAGSLTETAFVPEASVAAFLEEKHAKKNGVPPMNSDLDIISGNALLATARPGETSSGNGIGGAEDSFEGDIEIYVVKSGDTVEIVAGLFEVSTDTILSANDMKKGDKLKVGEVLLILPFSGVEHIVAKGETLNGIANKYKANLEDILSANDLEGANAKLSIGKKLMIPGAKMLSETKPKTTVASGGGSSSVPNVAGYFINPVPGARRSRGVIPGAHKGVDLAARTGTPIKASAGGTVLIARNGYNGGFGNYVVIQHQNGTKTLYAHMSKLGTTPGASVSQGEVIGYVGSTGHSTGPHLHFEVLGGKNPF